MFLVVESKSFDLRMVGTEEDILKLLRTVEEEGSLSHCQSK